MIESELLSLNGKPLTAFPVRQDEFSDFRRRYVDPRNPNEEKYLEYYIADRLFALKAGDVYIDIASQDCPFSRFAGQTPGVRAYRQDLYYLTNSEDPRDIAGDACTLPFAENYFSHISLFNSFEHFEDDRDRDFIIEAQRVLRPGGLLLMVPLEIGVEYSIETDAGYLDERGEKHLWGLGARYARTYNAKAFRDRVLAFAPKLSLEIYEIDDQWPRSADCYARWFATFRKVT